MMVCFKRRNYSLFCFGFGFCFVFCPKQENVFLYNPSLSYLGKHATHFLQNCQRNIKLAGRVMPYLLVRTKVLSSQREKKTEGKINYKYKESILRRAQLFHLVNLKLLFQVKSILGISPSLNGHEICICICMCVYI